MTPALFFFASTSIHPLSTNWFSSMVIVLFRYLEPLLYEGCVDLTARTVNTVADAPRYKSIIRQLDSTRGSRGIHSTCTYGLHVSKDDQQVFCLAGPKSKTRCQKELDQGYFSECCWSFVSCFTTTDTDRLTKGFKSPDFPAISNSPDNPFYMAPVSPAPHESSNTW